MTSVRMAWRLVGREREVAATADAVALAGRADDGRATPLVTITGPIGVGKSALAEVVAHTLRDRGDFDAVVRVDAAAESARASMREDVAAAAEASPSPSSILIVLDGCDGGDPRALVRDALACAPTATILVTARAPTRVAGEVVVELGPLATPEGDAPESPALDCLSSYLPVSTGAAPAATADRPALAALLRELDGLPLALALAAPRLSIMSPRALLHRLRQSRSVLERPGEGGAVRPFESALTGAIQSLSPRARGALSALTSLVGAATVETLEAIIGPPSSPAEARAIDVVGELRAGSLLVVAASGAEEPSPRLALLHCVRDFVLRSARPDELAAGIERHAAHFARLATALAPQIDARRSVERAALRDELMAVLERVTQGAWASPAMVDHALRLLVTVYAAPDAVPPVAYLPIVDAAVERTKDSGAEPGLVARALLVRARARHASGDVSGSTRDLLRAVQIARPARLRDVEAEATLELARLLARRQDLAAAAAHARAASIGFRDLGDTSREASSAAAAGDFERRRGRIDDARSAVDRAFALMIATPSAWSRPVVDAALRLHLETGDERALQATLGVARARVRGAPEHEASLLLTEAVALHDQGEMIAARARYASAAALAAHHTALEAEICLFDAVAALGLGKRGECLARLRVASDLGGAGTIASRVDELAAATAYALDAWFEPQWRGAAPAVDRARFATALVAAASADRPLNAALEVLDADGDDRVFARLLARALGSADAATAATAPAAEVARFDVEGRWFRLPAEPTVTLERRRPIASMLKLLVAERLARPGSAVSVDRLLAAGWPGERVQAEAGAHRVRVALSTLRKLGLRTVLLTSAEGYALDPAHKMTTAHEGAA